MFKVNKSKKGFTLVEMILSIAIVCMLGGIIAGVCASISNSFQATYSIDDAADYALLYTRGFENSFLANTQKPQGKKLDWYISNPSGSGDGTGTSVPTLILDAGTEGRVPVFDPKHIGTNSSGYKWSVCMFYKYDDANENVKYVIFLGDNYSKTNYVYMYNGEFWVPRFQERAKNAKATRTISVTGDSLSAATLKKYGFSDAQVAQIPANFFTNDKAKGNWGTKISFSG